MKPSIILSKSQVRRQLEWYVRRLASPSLQLDRKAEFLKQWLTSSISGMTPTVHRDVSAALRLLFASVPDEEVLEGLVLALRTRRLDRVIREYSQGELELFSQTVAPASRDAIQRR